MGTEVRLEALSLIHIVIVGGPKPYFDVLKGHGILDVLLILKLTVHDDYHQLLVKSTSSPLLMQALTSVIRT